MRNKNGCPFCDIGNYKDVDVNLFFTGKEYYCKRCGYVFAVYDSKTNKTIDLDKQTRYKSTLGDFYKNKQE